MANAAMLIVAYFAALLLNFGNFARFGKDEAAMKWGNFLGLPVNFLVFSIITVIVTAGTLKVFGQAIMDPVLIVERIGNPVVVIIGSVTFIVATMGINIVANFVSPAYDIANLYPERINFRLGGLITSVLSVLVCPWLFVASPQAITLVRQRVRRGAGADVRHHGRRLLLGEAPGGPRRGPLHHVAGRRIPLRWWLEPQGADGARRASGALSIGLSLLGAYGVDLRTWATGAG